jgi:hypothetical protein
MQKMQDSTWKDHVCHCYVDVGGAGADDDVAAAAAADAGVAGIVDIAGGVDSDAVTDADAVVAVGNGWSVDCSGAVGGS